MSNPHNLRNQNVNAQNFPSGDGMAVLPFEFHVTLDVFTENAILSIAMKPLRHIWDCTYGVHKNMALSMKRAKYSCC
ncbi:hypothetical protein I7I50_05693 [Histoplasma capsulatum G186AR]|uniref:Uncharacterized protein n=1 Tax=Ajellomyces capsulatus TaxID=5037 RepID=A0A8H7ZAS4_AJECA|nr:hypothetical protein I7I52_03953 [Histoplasma capsulatum]QSS76294.1 hypothetical protein I7I50_05693 [Histoplasma capsulatum G186AR]